MAQSDKNPIFEDKIEHVPDWIWEINQEGIVTYSNNIVSDTLGYNVQEIIGRPLLDFVPGEDKNRCIELMRSALDEGRALRNIHTHFYTKNKDTKTLAVSCVPISGNGKPAGLRGVARDITDHLDRLHLAEQVLEHSQTGVFVLLDNILVYVNQGLCELMGYTESEVLGTPIWKYVHPDDIAWLLDHQNRRLAGEDVSTEFVARGITKSGEVRYYELRISPLIYKGKFALLVNAADTTDEVLARESLAESERNFRDLVEKTSDWVWQINANFIYTYASPRAKEMFGYDPQEMIGKSIFDLMPTDGVEHIREIFEQSRRDKKPVVMLETGMLHRDGHVLTIETSAEPIFSNGDFLGYRGIDRDITTRKQIEEQLRKAFSERESILHAFPDVYFWLDTDGKILECHAADEAELYQPPGQFLNKRMQDVLPEDVGRRFAEAIAELKRTQSIVSLEYTLKIEGTEKHYEARMMLISTGTIIVIVRNITERYVANVSLTESRKMLELVLENIPQYVFWKDTNLVYLGCNDNFAEAAGVGSPEHIVGKTDYDLAWEKNEAESYRKWDRQVIDEDKPVLNIIESQRRPDGHISWVDTNKIPLHSAEGEVIGVLGTYEDITERRKAEQALHEAESKYRSLVEETMVGVYMIQDDHLVYVNPRFLEIFGAKQVDMLGQPPLKFVAPQDRVMVAENLRKRFSGETKTMRYAFKAQRIDETPIDVEVHTAVMDYQGRPAVIGSLWDITERKRYTEALQDNEERYRRLFEHSPDMVFVLSADTGTFISMNPAVTQTLGYAPYDVLGKTPGDISPEYQPDGKSSSEEAIRLIKAQPGAPAQRLEWVHKKKDGALVDCEISLVAYKQHGEVLIQAIARDITERKQAEESRRKLEQELDRQKRVFYRETILSVTGGKLNICDNVDVEPYIIRSSDMFEVEETSHVGAARRQTASKLAKYGLTEDRLDGFLVGIGEALTNAIKHGKHGTVHVGHDDDTVWVVVSDKGSGIESLILPRAVLFRGFSTKPSLGLGYSIMLEVSDRILLSTGPQGTSVVLIKEKVANELALATDFLPDTWDNIPG